MSKFQEDFRKEKRRIELELYVLVVLIIFIFMLLLALFIFNEYQLFYGINLIHAITAKLGLV